MNAVPPPRAPAPSPRARAKPARATTRRAPITIASWNVESLAARVAQLPEIAARLGSPDVLCLQELRVRPQDRSTTAAMAIALPGYVCHAALPDDPRNATFRGGRVYGVATFVRARLRPSAMRGVPWDREGRVVVTELDARRLAIVNVYAVNGTAKPYFDHALGRFHGDRHDFKRRFQEALLDECAQLRARGLDLVLIGDWNVSRSARDTYPRLRTEGPHARARAHLNDRLLPALDVVDAFRELHPDARKYTWFARVAPPALDAARVDYALVSRALLPRVTEADVLDDPAARAWSDHAPITLTLRA